MAMRRRDHGAWLLELTISILALTMVVAAALAVLRAQSREVRATYEERVALEAAEAQLEILEAAGWKDLPEEQRPLEMKIAGLENLDDVRGTLHVIAAPGSMRRILVEVAWTDSEGAGRSIKVRTLAGGAK